MFPGVVSIFCDWEKRGPLIWMYGSPWAEVLFDPCVHPFGLSVCSRVEGCRQILLYPKAFADSSGKVRGKAGVSVRYDAFGKSKPGDKVSEVFEGYSRTIDVLSAWYELCCFGASLVDDGKDAIKSL